MFRYLLDAAENSPFKGPLNPAHCEKSDDSMPLVETRTIQAADADPGDSCEFGSTKYFALCGVGGILSCGTTHTFVTPLGSYLFYSILLINSARDQS